MSLLSAAAKKQMENHKMYKLCIFDLDGTLLDTSQGLLSSANYGARQIGAKEISPEIFEGVIGVPIGDIYRQYYHIDSESENTAVKFFLEDYSDNCVNGVSVFPGVRELLKELKKANCLITLATMNTPEVAKKMLACVDLLQYFDFVSGRGANPLMTKAGMIREHLEKFDISQNDAVMIGDSMHDLHGAQEAGVEFVGVKWGYGFRNEVESEGWLLGIEEVSFRLLREQGVFQNGFGGLSEPVGGVSVDING